jgi:hypothetical protein
MAPAPPPAPSPGPAPPARVPPRRRRLVLVAAALVALGIIAVLALREDSGGSVGVSREGEVSPVVFGAYAFREQDREDFERRAAAGLSHPLYARSPGGAVATAARVERHRPEIEAAAREGGMDPDLLEAIVFLESAGRPNAIAGDDPEAASGLTQILAETAVNLLDLEVDLDRSRRLTRSITRANRRGQERRAARLRADRRRIDERFDPARALEATVRYLEIARERFGRDDLAVTSYHMGIGNLEGALRDYAGEEGGPIGEVVEDHELSYARLYFDSSPLRHREAHERLAGLGDDSANYYWKVLAARDIMALHRQDPDRLDELADLHGAKNSAEEVLHPPEETDVLEGPEDVEEAWSDGELVRIPDDPQRFRVRRSRQMGELAPRLERPPALYQGLRPQALSMLLYMSAGVEAISEARASLVATSAVRDREYQRVLVRANREATRNYSLHTTGYAFDLRRSYRTRAQARALQFMLDRMQALNLIAWVREPGAIHVTVAKDADELLPLLNATR